MTNFSLEETQNESDVMLPLKNALLAINFPPEEVTAQISELTEIIGSQIVEYAERQRESLEKIDENDLEMAEVSDRAYIQDISVLIMQTIDTYVTAIKSGLDQVEIERFNQALGI